MSSETSTRVTGESSSSSPATRLPSRPGIALAVLVSCQLMVGLDGSVINIALPNIALDLGISPTNLAWVVNAYILTFGGLLLLGGRAGDILGRRRLFIAGIVLFTVASLAGGFAGSSEWLLIARAVQGIGAAFAAPGTLALIATNFEEGPARNRALGAVTAAYGLSAVLGLFLGGFLTDVLSWRWVLFVNVPIGATIALLTPIFVAESERHPGRFDLRGAITSSLGMAFLVYGFIRAASDGWGNSLTVATLSIGVALIVLFVALELRAEQPITPLHLFHSRNRAASYACILLLAGPLFGVNFLLTQYVQNILDFSPLRAGLSFLPLAAGLLVAAGISTALLPRIGPNPVMITGIVLIGAALLWLSQLTETSHYASGLVGPMVLVGAGPGFAFTALNMSILTGVPGKDSGAASGLLEAMQWVGGSLGLAIFAAVYGTASSHAAGHTLANVAPALQTDHVLAYGMSKAFLVGVALTAVTLLVTLVAVSHRVPATLRDDTTTSAEPGEPSAAPV